MGNLQEATDFINEQFDKIDGKETNNEIQILQLQKQILQLQLELQKSQNNNESINENLNKKYNFQIHEGKLERKETDIKNWKRKEIKYIGSLDLPSSKKVIYSIDLYNPPIMKDGKLTLNFINGSYTKEIKLNYEISENNVLTIFKDKDNDGKINKEMYSRERKESIAKPIPHIYGIHPKYMKLNLSKIFKDTYSIKECKITLKITKNINSKHHNF